MKIVVASDTHGEFEPLRIILMNEPYADCYLHLGDVGGYEENIFPFAAVKGNCDFFSKNYPLYREIKTPIGLLRAEHKPISEKDLTTLYKRGVRVFLHGHTHKKEDIMLSNIRVLCPGSCSFPRDGTPSYLVIKIDEDILNVSFKTI